MLDTWFISEGQFYLCGLKSQRAQDLFLLGLFKETAWMDVCFLCRLCVCTCSAVCPSGRGCSGCVHSLSGWRRTAYTGRLQVSSGERSSNCARRIRPTCRPTLRQRSVNQTIGQSGYTCQHLKHSVVLGPPMDKGKPLITEPKQICMKSVHHSSLLRNWI